MTLHDRIRAVVEERLAVARAASGSRHGQTVTGEHWHWECPTCDSDIPITPVTMLDETLQCPADRDHYGATLRSVEDYPTESVGLLCHMIADGADDMSPVVGKFLADQAPADAILSAEHALWLLDEIAGWEHDAQSASVHCAAVDDGTCDCGLDERRARMLLALATRWRVEVDG